jgi:hypothetical protein
LVTDNKIILEKLEIVTKEKKMYMDLNVKLQLKNNELEEKIKALQNQRIEATNSSPWPEYETSDDVSKT